MRRCIVSFRRILRNFLVFTAIFVPTFLTFGCKTDADGSRAEYTLTFSANGGIGSIESIAKFENEEIVLPTEGFTRTDYEFTCWNALADGSGTSYAGGAKFKLTTDTILYAQWKKSEMPENSSESETKASYIIKFDANGGTGEMNEITVEAGSEVTISANTFSRDEWAFAGWNTKSDGTGTPHDDKAKITLNADITLFAQWTVTAENVVNAINNLTEGTHTVCVTGEIDETTLINIGKALRSSENVKVNLDLTKTTGLENIPSYAFNSRISLINIEIPESVTSIGNGAFWGCTGLTDVEIPKSVTSIEYNAFTGCRNVIRLSISEENEYYQAFNNCIYTKDGQTLIAIIGSPMDITKDFYLPTITKIDELVFQCGTVINLEIPEGVVRIEDSAFVFCKNLVSVKIPKSLNSINSLAFYGCTNLTTVNYNGTIAQWNDITYKGRLGSCKIICTDGIINE